MKFATLITSLLIVIAVLIPGKDLPDVHIGGYDKLIHMAMFAAWALAVRYDFRRRPLSYFIIVAVGILFSALTEVLQLLVEGRSFDVYDMGADALGLVAGLLLSEPLLNWINRFL